MFKKTIQTLALSVALTAALTFPTSALAWWDQWRHWHPDQHRGHHYDYHRSGHWDRHNGHYDYHDTSHYDRHDDHHDH